MKPPENLAALMAEKTNGQLQEIFQKPDDWLPETLEAASVELSHRGIQPQVSSKIVSRESRISGLFVKADEITRPLQPAFDPPSHQKLSALAVLSFLFAFSFPVTLIVGSVGGVVFGHLAYWRINQNSRLCGKTLAKWGIGIGYVSLAVFIFIAAKMINGMSGLH
jgi:hypothetical protein